MIPLWTLLAFLLGALPFSVWVGQLALGKEIRDYGDKNPGATNVLRAGNPVWFGLALALDISKAAAPVGLAYQIFGWQGWEIVPIALAPLLGHAFSPFLNWRGGKAIATTLGVWIGLTIWIVPLVGIILLVALSLTLRPHGWSMLTTMIGVLLFLIFVVGNPVLTAVCLTHIALIIWTHREDLQQRPKLQLKT
ncbi:MAG: glycerol-3-phosphate acyltransferase [Chloroflexota bacterium]